MFTFCSLASGSEGNASLLQADDFSVIIDLGISCSRLEKELALVNVLPENIQAIFITHAHSDHVKGLATFQKKYQAPLYLKKDTYNVLGRKGLFSRGSAPINFLESDELQVGPITVNIFRLPHQGWLKSGADDAGAHIGFKFTYKDKTIGYFTDLGKMPEDIFQYIKDCDYYFLEANHDVLWQRIAKRPQGVIDRNLQNFGHLSNHQAGEILSKVLVPQKAQRRTKGVMLAHLSRDCNNPILAEDTILKTFTDKHIEPIEIKFAPQKKISEMIRIA